MKKRLLISGLIILVYGLLIGHEIVLGHHTSHGTSSYQHNQANANHKHHHGSSSFPCLLDMNPHFVPTNPNHIASPDNSTTISFDYLLPNDPFSHDKQLHPSPLLLLLTKFELPLTPIIRSQSLRGPPAA